MFSFPKFLFINHALHHRAFLAWPQLAVCGWCDLRQNLLRRNGFEIFLRIAVGGVDKGGRGVF